MLGYYETNDCCNSCDKPLQNTYEIITPNANLAVDLDVVKSYLRVDGTTDDALITLLIQNATLVAEKYTGIEFLNKGFKTYRDCFYSCIELEKSKLVSVESVKYFDTDDVEQTLADTEYAVTSESIYSRIYSTNTNDGFPDTKTTGYQNVIVEFTAGFGIDNTFVPDDIKLALMLMVSNSYANRGDCNDCAGLSMTGNVTPPGAKAILSQYRIIGIC